MPSPDDPALFQMDEDEASTPSPAQDPALPEEWEDDDSLIQWMLSLTPTERLERAQGFMTASGPSAMDAAPDFAEQASRDKDRATIPILRRTLRLRGESGS